jgi:hypothetical protein
MKNRICLILALAAICSVMSTAALAAENSYLYLVQGIPGLDYSPTTDPQFPIDVLVNDEVCYVHGLSFGTIDGPLTLAPGSYDVKISVANSLAPCSNSPLVDSTIPLGEAKDVTAVLALDSTGSPTLMTFTNNFSVITPNSARLSFALAADSPAVEVILENIGTKKTYTYSANPGTLINEPLPAGSYTIQVNQGTTVLVPATGLTLYSQSAAMIVATGEAANNTVTLQTKIVRNVI